MALPDSLLRAPAQPADESLRYTIVPRPKRAFNTVLDAHDLFPVGNAFMAEVTSRVSADGPARRFELITRQELHRAALHEHLVCDIDGGLRARSFDRSLTEHGGRELRRERVDFSKGALPLPLDVYPEVCLPFLLRFQPFDRERRSAHAWISDRMVARVYFEVEGHRSLSVPAGRFDVTDVRMYPDLNDWVKMPRVLAELSKPFLPKYHMAYETRAPHRLVRFEGSYGPPGAPEVILELASLT